MRKVLLIASAEWRLMYRSRLTMLGLSMLLALSIVATLTSIAQRNENDALRARYQQQANAVFDGAPARHPHRMVHYGHFVFRPLPALAAFDPGVDTFTGNTIYLEGHRQNSANFGDVRQNSLLVRFGQMTPAFVLQTLAPLLLVFVGFGIIAREKDRGTLPQLLAQGVGARTLLSGKLLALSCIAVSMLIPAALALVWLVVAQNAPTLLSITILAGYALYILLWSILITFVSALVKSARSAQMALICIWVVTVILIPRMVADSALAMYPSLSSVETNISVQDDLRRMGDSHNPSDPYFNEFKEKTLSQYGVQRIEDLPINYRGLLAVEGERLETELFGMYAAREHAAHQEQNRLSDTVAVLSPMMALKRLSISLAGTDLEGHQRFLKQAEAYRFALVQQLNTLQATAVTYADDVNRNKDVEAARRVRISPSHWQDIPDFRFRPANSSELLRASIPGALILIGWLACLGVASIFVIRNLGNAE
jgi:ABC-2 type transport system permease protein